MNTYAWKDLRVGLTASFSACITEEMMSGFGAFTGDTNPLHVDASFARAAGFNAPIVYGMLTASFYSTLVGMHLPGRYGILQGIDIDFHRPVYVATQLIVSGEILFLSDAVRRAEIGAKIRDPNGFLISKAKIRAGVHDA